MKISNKKKKKTHAISSLYSDWWQTRLERLPSWLFAPDPEPFPTPPTAEEFHKLATESQSRVTEEDYKRELERIKQLANERKALHDEMSKTIKRVFYALIGASLFCVVTLAGTPDTEVMAPATRVRLPALNYDMGLEAFLFVGPMVLIALAVYLHIFVGQHRRLAMAPESTHPMLANFSDWTPQIAVYLIFYWMVPVTLAVFAWTAWAKPYGPVLGLVALLTAAASALLQFRRCPPAWRAYALPALLAFYILFCMSFSQATAARKLYLSKADLSDAELHEVDLSGAILSGADLSNAKLSGADLSGADLSGSTLTGADLSRTRLLGTNLSGAKLSNANLSNADLSDATLTKAILSNSDLSDAKLYGANFAKSDLSEANLSRADLAEADLLDAKLSGANLSEAKLPGANLARADMSGANLGKANLSNAKLPGANLFKAKLPGANLAKADMSGANLGEANLSNAELPGANLFEAELPGASLFEAKLFRSNLSGANLAGANLSGSKLSGAKLPRADLSEVNSVGADFSGADLSEVKIDDKSLEYQNILDKTCGDENTRLPEGLVIKHCLIDQARVRTIDDQELISVGVAGPMSP